jgi:L-fuculokinase
VRDLAIVLDCGATNASAVAVSSGGEIVAAASRPNAPVAQPGGDAGWLVWDLDEIWAKLADACRQVCSSLAADSVRAVAVTTFGADGAPVRRDGALSYPVISWQCSRTAALAEEVRSSFDPFEIYRETGYQIISFNTLLRLMWLREHAPDALDEAHCWMMTPGLLSHRLCGEFSIDPTIASTTMAVDSARRTWSEKMLAMAALDSSFFPRWAEPGQVIGKVHSQAAQATGLPEGIPVVAAGHDTQFAIIGSGAAQEQAILSSGTWEILTVRSGRYQPDQAGFEDGLLIECDAAPGFWNPQMLMIASGVLEWIRRHFYGEIREGEGAHLRMISDAQQIEPGSGGVTIIPSFVPDTGPLKRLGIPGSIHGLTLTTARGQVYRAGLEGLSFQLRQALERLAHSTGAQPTGIRIVGGGSRNALWNQIRADATGLPVTALEQTEATGLGAAMFAFMGAGLFRSLDEAKQAMRLKSRVFEPSPDRERYDEIFARYQSLASAFGKL